MSIFVLIFMLSNNLTCQMWEAVCRYFLSLNQSDQWSGACGPLPFFHGKMIFSFPLNCHY